MSKESIIDKLYDERSKQFSIKTKEDLLNLLEDSEREFYFYLTYAYIRNLDLADIIDNSVTAIRIGISLFCLQAEAVGLSSIKKYYDRFLVVDESSVQAYKVLSEFSISDKREKIVEKLNIADKLY